MKARRLTALALVPWLGLAALAAAAEAPAGGPASWVPRFPLPESGLELSRHTEVGAFFDVAGRRSAVFGYENRSLEAWVYPLKVLDDFRLSFRLEGYPLDIEGAQIATGITVRPEATIFTYSHAAFTVRQVTFAPLDEPGIVMLLDVRSVLPMTVTGSFRPRLRLMWPAGLMTGDLGWDEKARVYSITEETKRFAAVIGCPGARDLSVMPYQEEPRDVPIRFEVAVPPAAMASHYLPIVIAGSVEGRDAAKAAYDRLLASARELYERNVAHYRTLQERTLAIDTPDDRLDTAFAWAKVGIDKGLVANPLLGPGLVAGYRTSGESERPGFAWHFGRDALWTAFAIDAYGDFELSRSALEFLRRFQRADGKIPHEVSQSATLVPWVTDYKYPWEAADATPLYVIAQAEHWRASGDTTYLRAAWESIVKAWRFSQATDADGNGLVENTKVGHGWTEGSPPYPPHEEIYLQGLWIEACRRMAELAEAMGDGALAAAAGAAAERTRSAVEKTYWLADRGFYAFATALPRPEKHYDAEPGPNRARRQARIESLRGRTLVDEDTVLPAVPLWWRVLDPARADLEIDHLGSAALATDWGHRLLSSSSELYDPLSYHYGSVWGLFTGWASVAAYAHGRPHVGYQALMANAELTFQGALGYVTELLSGEFNTPFGRSSHHQVWSEAMVVSPVLRGLFGLEARDGGKTLALAPQLPAHWDRSTLRNVALGDARYEITLERAARRMEIRLTRRAGTAARRVVVSPAFPLDAGVQGVTVNGREARFQVAREGDVQRAAVTLDAAAGPGPHRVVFTHTPGTEVEPLVDAPEPGASSRGLRVLRARAAAGALHLRLEGLAGRTYRLRVRTPRHLAGTAGAAVTPTPDGAEIAISFDGTPGSYVRRDLALPLR